MQNFDDDLTRFINALAGKNATSDFWLIHASTWGVPFLILMVAAQWWLGSDRRANRHVLIATGLSFGLALTFNQVILLFIHRARPYDAGITRLLIDKTSDPSFPSDHATATAAIAAAFIFHGAPSRGMIFAAAATVISFTRVYIGTHYVSDVVGGAVTGILAAWLIVRLYEPGTKFDKALTGIL